MKASSRDAIIAEIERNMILAGEKSLEDGMANFAKLLEFFLRHYDQMSTKAQIQAVLDEMPEPSWGKMRFWLAVLKYLPQLVRYGLKEIATKMEDEGTIPEIPRGRPGLDAFTREKIVAHVGTLHMKGYSLIQAKGSAAKKFGVSESTIQRAWDDRGNSGEVDFRSVLRFLADEMSST